MRSEGISVSFADLYFYNWLSLSAPFMSGCFSSKFHKELYYDKDEIVKIRKAGISKIIKFLNNRLFITTNYFLDDFTSIKSEGRAAPLSAV